jgi:hypothetical protein
MSPEELEFWREVNALIAPVTETTIEYRLHYDDAGDIVLCTMVDHPESQQYLVVDKATYDRYFDYRVVKGQLKKIDHNSDFNVKLQRSTKGFCVVKNHAGIILEPGETYNHTEYYDTNR